MISPVATLPVLSGTGATLVPVPPVSVYAYAESSLGGTTANRPVTPPHQTPYYDTDLQELIFYNRDRTRWESFRGDNRT